MRKWFILAAFLIAAPAFAQKTYIQCGTLIDGVANSPKTNMTIVVEGNKIISIENGFQQGTGADKVGRK